LKKDKADQEKLKAEIEEEKAKLDDLNNKKEALDKKWKAALVKSGTEHNDKINDLNDEI